jgi:cell division protein FtsB
MIFRWKTTRPGDILQQLIRAEQNAQGDHFNRLEFISPFTASIRRRRFQVFLFLLSIVLSFETYTAVRQVQDYGSFQKSRFRLDIHSKEKLDQISGRNISLGLRHNGCVKHSTIVTLQNDASTSSKNFTSNVIDLSQPLEIDGFNIDLEANVYMTFSALLMGSGANGSWDIVGSSAYRFAPTQIRLLNREVLFSGNKWSFDYLPPWPLIASNVMNYLLLAVACAGSAVLGALQQAELSRQFFTWFFLIIALSELIAGIGFIAVQQAENAALLLLRAICYSILSAALWRAEAVFFDWLRVLTAMNLIGRVLDDCVVSNDCSFLAVNPPADDVFFFLAAVFFTLRRHRILVRRVRAVQPDQALLDAEWQRLLSVPSERAALQRLAEEVEAVRAECPSRPAQQLNRPIVLPTQLPAQPAAAEDARTGALLGWLKLVGRRLEAGRHAAADAEDELDGWRKTMAGQADPGRPVHSLDQLYSQVCVRERERARFSETEKGREGRGRNGCVEGRERGWERICTCP